MKQLDTFYIDGGWSAPAALRWGTVINPATEMTAGRVALGASADVDRAVAAARCAFASFAVTTRDQRIDLLSGIIARFKARSGDLAAAMTEEMGAPAAFSRDVQVASGLEHFERTLDVLRTFEFEQRRGTTLVSREPIGVCALITPWNWPINQIACKVAPALAAGCTMVLKPSEIAPFSATVFAEILHEAGVPAGVFNLVHGDGAGVGRALSTHADVDLVSFTGSTRAGIQVAKDAADTVKRVLQELGGNSANIILPDADLYSAVSNGVASCFLNSGQSCDSPARMLVPVERMDEAMAIAQTAATAFAVGLADAPGTALGLVLGPVSSKAQFDKVQRLISVGIAEGAVLVAGGAGRPDGLTSGYFVRPTVFGRVRPEMTIAREEIFGPVLSMIAYHSEDEAITIANGTEYGLAAYVQSGDLGHARRVAARLRAGTVQINYPAADYLAPFGGYKRSGNGREYGEFGLAEFLELKANIGYFAS